MHKRPVADQDPGDFPLPPSVIPCHDRSTPAVDATPPQAPEHRKPAESFAAYGDNPISIENVRPAIIPDAPRRADADSLGPLDVRNFCYVYYFDRSEPRPPISSPQSILDKLRLERSSRLCSANLPSDISRYVIGPMLDDLSPAVLSCSKAYCIALDHIRIPSPVVRTSLILPSGLIAVVYTLDFISNLFSIGIYHPSGAILAEIFAYADLPAAIINRQGGLADTTQGSNVGTLRCAIMPDGRLGVHYESVACGRPRPPARSFAIDIDIYSTSPKVCDEVSIYAVLVAAQAEEILTHLEEFYRHSPSGSDSYKFIYKIMQRQQSIDILPPEGLSFLEKRSCLPEPKTYVIDWLSKRAFFLAFNKRGALFIVPYCTDQWTALEPIYLFHTRGRTYTYQPDTTFSLMLGPRGELYAYERIPENTATWCAMIRICTLLSRKPWGIENFYVRFTEMVNPAC